MNFRRFAKRVLSDAQRNFPVIASRYDRLARENYVAQIMRQKGIMAGFYEVNNFIKLRHDRDGSYLKGRPVARIGRAAVKQGRVVHLGKLMCMFLCDGPLHKVEFERGNNGR